MNVFNDKAYILGVSNIELEKAKEEHSPYEVSYAKKDIIEIDLDGKVRKIGYTYGGGVKIIDGALYTYDYDIGSSKDRIYEVNKFELD